MDKYRILIVEDDAGLNRGIALALNEEKLTFYPAYSLTEARKIWHQENPDMVLLDINLPDGSGYDFLRDIRKTSEIPVLMITANDLETDEVTGFSLGADDYITKPFSLMVLRARVERMRERALKKEKSDGYRDETYDFRFEEMRFLVEGEEVILSKTEQKLLRLFVTHANQTLVRERLVDAVWTDGAEYVDENALSVAVNRLRRKLGGKNRACPIQTVYGIGYVWKN